MSVQKLAFLSVTTPTAVSGVTTSFRLPIPTAMASKMFTLLSDSEYSITHPSNDDTIEYRVSSVCTFKHPSVLELHRVARAARILTADGPYYSYEDQGYFSRAYGMLLDLLNPSVRVQRKQPSPISFSIELGEVLPATTVCIPKKWILS